jgi:hypothetical protein
MWRLRKVVARHFTVKKPSESEGIYAKFASHNWRFEYAIPDKVVCFNKFKVSGRISLET